MGLSRNSVPVSLQNPQASKVAPEYATGPGLDVALSATHQNQGTIDIPNINVSLILENPALLWLYCLTFMEDIETQLSVYWVHLGETKGT